MFSGPVLRQGQCDFGEGFVHEPHPAFAGSLSNLKRKVPRPQTGMATLFDVALRASKAVDQKVAQPLLGAIAIVLGIHRPKDIVVIHPAIKSGDQPRKAIFANERKKRSSFMKKFSASLSWPPRR